jgi:DNA-binding transcriptional regulator YiaG
VKKPKVSKEDIRAARLKAKLTQSDAAALIGYTVRAWEDWEAGKRNMRLVLFEMFIERIK